MAGIAEAKLRRPAVDQAEAQDGLFQEVDRIHEVVAGGGEFGLLLRRGLGQLHGCDQHAVALILDPGIALDMAAHDHAPWEALSLYRGRFKHTAYERVDDGSKLGYAKLNIIEDRVLEPGEFAMIYPPKDIHSFHGLTEDTWAVFVASGVPSPERKYFNTVDNTYIQRLKEDPKALAPKH